MDILSFYLVYLVPFSVIAGYMLGGAYTFLTPVVVFLIVPLLDIVIGKDTGNIPEDRTREMEEVFGYRLATWFCAPVQMGLVFWGAYVVTYEELTFLECCGFVFSMGTSSGVLGINVAHELAHRVNTKLEPGLSRLMLWSVLYMHWGLEHVVGHHRMVATPEDPATARFGESFYRFLPRTVFGGFNSAWSFEAERLGRAGKPAWSPENRIAVALLFQTSLLILIALVFGGLALIYWILQAAIAITLLEIVNYIEHYGLLRKQTGENRYEPVKPRHSWNSSNWLTNRFLFNLQRHSDHHYKPGRRYQVLRHHDESPQLPTGYAGMILLAAVPRLWRSVMDPKVEAGRGRSD
ncbi:MAG: alkane 1-monooxygenase [Desulfobacteraceae bacterium]|nr:MAG: alkane 1-monooxygenase [Desulfobacteraceae bacterium]